MSRVMFTQGCGAPGGGWLLLHGLAASLGTLATGTVVGAAVGAGVEGAAVAGAVATGATGADEAAGADAALALGRLDHIWSRFL